MKKEEFKKDYNSLEGIPKFELWKIAMCDINDFDCNNGSVTMTLIFAYDKQTKEEIFDTVWDYQDSEGYDMESIKRKYSIPSHVFISKN